jgi:hypothetical protein
MSVLDTKLLEKCCSRCCIIKNNNLFIPNRNICKECKNLKSREKYNLIKIDNELEQKCSSCNILKLNSLFIKNRKICIECNNNKRRINYQTNEEHRIKTIKQSTEYKQKKIIEKNKIKELEIGINNIQCNYCHKIKSNNNFRHNRLKCKDCERDEPISKIIRNVRSRIFSAIKFKSNHTIYYLGCNCSDYLKWLLSCNLNFTFDNYGNEWHIDHVIPLSKFDILNEEQQVVAFNWRNTMPLSVKENLSKNNKIIKPQIVQHYNKLVEYHTSHKLDLPQVFIELFAKHLDAGNPLEPSLPLTLGNICEELG